MLELVFTYIEFIDRWYLLQMGFLDAKERIFDIVLTDRGRELLSQNLLDFEFFAFSDEGVDYGAALTASLLESGSVDDYVRRTLSLEATQFKDSCEQRDMKTFLYTTPSRRRTLPDFVTNFDDTPDIVAKRSYYVDKLVLSAESQNTLLADPVAVVMQSDIPQKTAQVQMEQYLLDQQVAQTTDRLTQGLNVTGMAIGPTQIMVSNRTILDTVSGLVQDLGTYKPPAQDDVSVISVSTDLDIVTGLSRVKINLSLQSSEGEVSDISGYLIEVFESGSDGVITKLFEEDVVDVLEDKVIKEGFDKDMFIDIDVTTSELISEAQRLERRELRRQQDAMRRLQRDLRRKLRGN